MNKHLKLYLERFSNNSISNKSLQSFFTDYSTKDYWQNLPYIWDIEKFCINLLSAHRSDQKICIYSDYDTDAVTATAVMYWGLIETGVKSENLSTYAPDRFTEGYGLNPEAISSLSQTFNLIITVDCGINSVKEAEIVKKSSNCKLLITDHHHLQDKIPDAKAVVNPRLNKRLFENQISVEDEEYQLFDLEKTETEFAQNWLKKIHKHKQNLAVQNCLSESVTGVGVAWFCVLWYGYFVQELEEFKNKKV